MPYDSISFPIQIIFDLLSTQVFYTRLKHLTVLKIFPDIIWKHHWNILKYKTL